MARFEMDSGVFHVAAAALSCRPATPLAPRPWIDALLDSPGCGLALRLRFHGGQVMGCLLVSAKEPSPTPGQVLSRRLTAPYEREGTRFAESVEEYDRLVPAAPGLQIWLNRRGFHSGGRPVVADFKLLPLLGRFAAHLDDEAFGLVYQVNLCRHCVEPEDRRAVRKYLARVQLDSPFPTPMTDLQAAIARRLLVADFLADEMIATDDRATFGMILREVDESFRANMAPFGFDKPPIEAGRFDDLFVSGLHSSHFGEPRDLLCDSAGSLTASEVRRFFETPVPLPRADRDPSPIDGERPVFLSYASKDIINASAVIGHLESHGIGCWIAPRDIRPGDAYPEAIIRGINGSKVVLVLLSDSSNLSPHVHREVERALNRKALIIPMRLEDVRPTGTMEYLLSMCQWIDAFDNRMDLALAGLLDLLKGHLVARPKS